MTALRTVVSILTFIVLVGGCANSDGEHRKGVLKGINVQVKSFGSVDALFSLDDTGDAREALHSGKLKIVEGCLFVGDALVVWASGTESKVEELVQKASRSETEGVSLEGGGQGKKEGETNLSKAEVPCSFDNVWFATKVLSEKVE